MCIIPGMSSLRYQLAAVSREACYCSDLPWHLAVDGQHDCSGKASGEGEGARGQLHTAW